MPCSFHDQIGGSGDDYTVLTTVRATLWTQMTQTIIIITVLSAGMVETHRLTNNLIDLKTAVASEVVDKCYLHAG